MIQTDIQQGVLTVELCSPKTRNAMSLTLAEKIQNAVSSPEVKALLVTSQGPIFCSGGSLKEYAATVSYTHLTLPTKA